MTIGLDVVERLVALAVIAALYPTAQRRLSRAPAKFRQPLHGLLFGAGAALATLLPGVGANAGSDVAIGLAGLCVGPISAAISAALALAGRVAFAPDGLSASLAQFTASALVGWSIAQFAARRGDALRLGHLLALGLALAAITTVTPLLAAATVGPISIDGFGIGPAATALAGALAIGWLLFDETHRAEAQRRLATSEANFRLIAELSSDVIVRRTMDGRRTYVSPSVRRVFGYEPEELLGQSVFELMHPDDVERVRGAMTDPGNDAHSTATWRLRHKAGHYIWVEGVRRFLIDPKTREPTEVMSAARDVTARKAAEAELQLARDAAEAASRAKSEFLAKMSHEIRTPMNGIIGMNTLLLETALDESQRHYATVVQQSAEALLTVINDILDISKLEAGKVKLEFIEFDLVETVESALALLDAKAREKHLELAAFIEPAVQAAFRGDPTRLRQVLLNLLSNAIKFTERGGVSVEVILARGTRRQSPEKPPAVRFVVSDSGIGIAEHMLSQLFQKFTQADGSVTRRFGGTGLGLAICRQLVELMGGEIGVTSQPSVGSKFWFEVPLARSTRPRLQDGTLLMRLKSLRALVVDDFAMNREIISRQLAELGMAVDTAEGGAGALAAVARAHKADQPYAIALIDRTMPDMSGEALARHLRQTPAAAGLRCVLIASDSAGPAASRAVDAVLGRPLRQAELLACLTQFFDRAETAATASDAPRQRLAAPGVTARRLRILLAEDNEINQQFGLALLGLAGHDVEVVGDGRRAIDAVLRKRFDVVLMDVQMPELDGLAATKAIRALPSPACDVWIIALTAHAMAGAREQYLAAGMDDYMAKPIESAALLAKLAEISHRLAPVENVTSQPEPAPPRPEIAATTNAQAALDTASLDALEAALPVEKLRDLVRMYLGHLDESIAQIEALSRQADLSGLARAAHTIVGTAGNVGAARVSALAREIEKAALADDHGAVLRLAGALNKAFDAAARALREWLDARTAAPEAEPPRRAAH
jgi:PAS domain S-box-containing protein